MHSQLSSKNVTWRSYSAPEPEELAELVREIKLTPLDAEFIVQNFHRSEIAIRADYIIILIHIPVFNKRTRITTGAPLYLIVRADTLWTLTYENIVVLDKIIRDFKESPDKQADYFESGALELGLFVAGAIYASAFHKLERLNKHINIAEDAVFQGNERKMVEEISILVRDVMDFRKIIRPQRQLFATPSPHSLLTAAATAQWQRLHSQVNKVWDFLESLSEAVLQLSETNQTLLQHKQNQLLRLLTYYSILSIPIYVLLEWLTPRGPGASRLDLVIYWVLLGVLIAVPIGIFYRFRRKQIY